MQPKTQKPQRHCWTPAMRHTAVATAVAACFSGAVFIDEVRANPTAPTVVHGTATFATVGNILNITNSPNAIINWGSFSIGVNELTRFIQQSGSSAVLNRVIGQDPSAILGALQSNGRVFIINPNGIVFGAGAQINVAGLVASTLNLSNEDFLNNRMKFTDGAGAGSVVNEGSITGGSVYLIGKAVSNDGLITSPNGEVILAAGNSVELVNPGTPNLRVEVVAPDNEARNLGTVTADAGRIGIYAGLVKQGGTLNASSAVAEGGRILLKAAKNTTLDATSQTKASGTTGGTITIQSGDTTLVSGKMEATGNTGTGGTVQVLGNKVGLIDAAAIDASGQTGGGTVLVGGDYQGKNPDVQNAFRTYVGQDVTINADAIAEGDGGRVIVWADDVTRYYGDISARGGANGGDGGFAEVSGKRVLDFQGTADLGAGNGAIGTLLLDPENIDIEAAGSAPLLPVTGGVGYEFADAYGGNISIAPSTLNASTANIILQANDTINVNDPISLANDNVSLTMQAGGFLNVNGSITTRGGAITLVAGDPGGTASEGALYINQALNTTGGGFTNGANINLSAPISDVGGNSVYINANVNAGATATVNITGQRLDHVAGTITGAFVNVSTDSLGSGDITLSGGNMQTLGGGNVYLESDRDIKVTSGYSIVASGGSVALFSDSDGNDDGFISINNAVINANNISMTGGNGYAVGNSLNPGISITNNSQIIGNGSVDLRGIGNAVTGGHGVLVDGSFVHNNSGNTYVEGAGGVGTGFHGVMLTNAAILNLGGSGNVEVLANGTGTAADGVNLGANAAIGTLGNGSVRVTGSGSGGGRGINMQGVGTASIGGTNATQILLNSLSGGMVLDGSVTACQACGSITLKSTAGADATTAALTASGLRVLGTGTFNIDSSSNSLDTVAAFLSGGPNLLHVHDQNALQVGTVSSYDGAATTATTGVNVGVGAGSIVDLHTVGALINGGGTVTSGGQIILDAASIGATGMGNYMSINRGATGTASLTSSSGGIFVEQAPGSASMLMSSYTISAPAGQTVALASSGGPLIVNTSLSFALNDLELYTTGANDIQFNAGAPGTIAAGSLTLEPAVGRNVLFNSGVSPWNINAPVMVGNNAAVDVSGGQTVNFNGTFDSTGPISVGAGSTLNFNTGSVMLSGDLNLSGTLGGSADLATGGVFNWSGGTVGGSGQLITSSTATTNITGLVALAPGKTWGNDGTVNFTGVSTLDLGDSTTPAFFNNNASGVVNIGSTANWSFLSDPSTQIGQISNSGTINVNNTTSWEALYDQTSTGILNIATGQSLSMQNGNTLAGTYNIGGGSTLTLSEVHGGIRKFSGATINLVGALAFNVPTVLEDTRLFYTGGTGDYTISAANLSHLGNIEYRATGNLTLASALSTLTGGITLVADSDNNGLGSIFMNSSAAGINHSGVTGAIVLIAGEDIVHTGGALQINTSSAAINLTAGRDILHTGAGTGQINTSSGAMTLVAGRDIVHSAGASQINNFTGAMLLQAGRDILHTGAGTGQINTSSGAMSLIAGQDIVHGAGVSQINTSSGAMLLQAGRDITHNATSNFNTGSGSMTINAGLDFLVSNSGSVNTSSAQTITVGNDLTLTSSGRINASGAGNQNINVGNNLTLINGADIFKNNTAGAQNIMVGGSALLSGSGNQAEILSLAPQNLSVAGNLDLMGARILATGSPQTINVGGNVSLTGTTVDSVIINTVAAQTISVGGELTLQGSMGSSGTAVISGANQSITVDGNMSLTGGSGSNAFALISGSPDVGSAANPMKVGGVIQMTAGTGAGAFANIESASPTSVYVFFPNLGSGGYFVNGVEGVVYDAATSTGFIAGGSPAILNTNLLVTYGGIGGGGGSGGVPSGDTLEIPTQNLIVALNESTEPPEAQKEKDVFKETEDDKKKDAPVCK